MTSKGKSKYVGINLNAKLGVSKRNRRRGSDNLVVLSSEAIPVKRRGFGEEEEEEKEEEISEKETKNAWCTMDKVVEKSQSASEEFPDLEDGVRTKTPLKNATSNENSSIPPNFKLQTVLPKNRMNNPADSASKNEKPYC